MLGEITQIPVTVYTDPKILKNEIDTVFSDYPMLAGHTSSVRNPGDYLLSDWPKLPYLIIRDSKRKLRAFLNICRHRGARIVSGHEPNLKAFVCPFHGWTYGLDGQLKGITQAHNFPNLDRDKFSLIELPVIEQSGLIWIHPTPAKNIDLNTYLGPIGDDIEHFSLEKLIRYKKNCVIKNSNWKLLIKTYLEGYHVPYLHKETLARAFKNGVIAHYEHHPHIRLFAARSNFSSITNTPPESRKILDYASVYYSLFPQAFFIMHPDYVSINMFYPLAPDRTIWTHEMLYNPSDFPEASDQNALENRFTFTNDTVFDQEDFSVAENIQCNLEHEPNQFHTLGINEGLLAIFQENINRAVNSTAT